MENHVLEMMTQEARLRLFKLKEIPPPSGMAQEVIRIAADDMVDISKLVNVIEKSPELTARILRCANSAYYGQRKHIATVKEAIIRVMGLSLTKSLVLAMALAGPFDFSRCPNFDPQRYWFVSVVSGSLSQELAKHLAIKEKPDPASAYTAGLIHNLGLLALVHAFPKEMSNALEIDDPVTIQENIFKLLGMDQLVAGAWLAQRWGLPEELILVILHHRDPSYRGQSWPLVNLIGLTSLLAEGLYSGQPIPSTKIFPEVLIPDQDVEKVVNQFAEHVEAIKDLASLLANGN